jgi:hypothetical protein
LVAGNATNAQIAQHYKLTENLKANSSQIVALRHSTVVQGEKASHITVHCFLQSLIADLFEVSPQISDNPNPSLLLRGRLPTPTPLIIAFSINLGTNKLEIM